MKKLLTAVVLLTVTCLSVRAQNQKQKQGDSANIDAYIEMLRSDLKTKKTALIAQAVPLSESESAAFWPVYRKYDLDLTTLNDERVAIIKDYGANYSSMSEAKAKELGDRFLAWEDKRVSLKRKYFQEFGKILPAIKAVRIMQVENRVSLLIDLQIAAAVPLMQ